MNKNEPDYKALMSKENLSSKEAFILILKMFDLIADGFFMCLAFPFIFLGAGALLLAKNLKKWQGTHIEFLQALCVLFSDAMDLIVKALEPRNNIKDIYPRPNRR